MPTSPHLPHGRDTAVGTAPSPGGEAVGASPARSQRGILLALTQLGVMQVAVAAGAVVRNKVMAVYLQPAGFGEFMQLTAIAAVVYGVVQFGMPVGLSRNAAAAAEGPERQEQLSTANALTVCLAFASVLVAVVVLFSPAGTPLLAYLGVQGGLEQKLLLLVLLAIAPVEVLRSNYASFLQGILDIKGLSTKRSVAILLGTVAAVPLIMLFRTVGACVQMAVASLLVAVLLGRRCAALGYRALGLSWNRRVAATLALLGGASLVIGFSQSSVDTLVRAALIATAGAAGNGLYQAALSLSWQLTAVILGSVGTYALATLSQTTDRKVVAAGMRDLLIVVLPIAAFGLGALGLFCHLLLALLFSPAFASSARFLPLLLAANYVQVAAWVVGAPLIGFGMVRAWVIVQLLGAGLRYAVTMWLFRLVGAYAVPGGFLFAMVFDLAANVFVCKRVIGLGIDRRAAVIFVAGGAAMLVAAWAGQSARTLWVYAAGFAQLAGVALAMAWPEVRAFVRGRLARG